MREAHEHYRRGTDCAVCGPEVCPRFRRVLFRRSSTPPPSQPSAGPDIKMVSSPGVPVATGPLAIVSDFRSYAARALAAG